MVVIVVKMSDSHPSRNGGPGWSWGGRMASWSLAIGAVTGAMCNTW